MAHRLLWLLAALLLLTVPLGAQDDSDAEQISIGTLITGRLDDASPREVYSINGTRGGIVRIQLRATSGDLDPVLAMFDPSNVLLMRRDDTSGTQDVDITLTFQENGVYLIIVGRFGYHLGTTSGEYELSITRVGVSSAEGSTLQYGIPITNTITNTQPRLFFTFQADAGDILNIAMIRSSGSLDPYLQVLDANRFLIAENDDATGTTRNALVQNLLVERTGTYIIVATRYGQAAGDSAGSFVLSVQEAGNSGLGNSSLAPAPLVFDQSVTGALNENTYEVYYSFEGETDQLVTITMDRVEFEGQLDPYLILANAGFQSLVENDDGGAGTNARIERFRLPADGIYHVIATRFERASGTTFGQFSLTVSDEGNAFDGVESAIPRLLYGTSVDDAISNEDPDSLFVFWGTEGERVIIDMDVTSGDLDGVLELLDSNQVRMLRDDDGGSGTNARIDTVLTYTGVHYIRATRYDGASGNVNTTGNYRLTLTRIINSEIP